MAMGKATAVANPDGTISRGNGTSYAAPAIAGLMACLKEAHPERTNMQLISAVRQSGDRYRNPSASEGYGYGIADGCKAHEILLEIDAYYGKSPKWVVNDLLRYKQRKNRILFRPRNKTNSLFQLVLKDIFENEILKSASTKNIDLSDLKSGDYLIDVYFKNGEIKTVYFKI